MGGVMPAWAPGLTATVPALGPQPLSFTVS